MNDPATRSALATDPGQKAIPVPRLAWPGFHFSFACLLLILLVVGFWPTDYGTLAISPLLHVHGIIGTAWVLFFLLQTVWIARGHRRIHMAMGWIGAVLAAGMVLMGLLLAIDVIAAGVASERIVQAQRFSILPLATSMRIGTEVGICRMADKLTNRARDDGRGNLQRPRHFHDGTPLIPNRGDVSMTRTPQGCSW